MKEKVFEALKFLNIYKREFTDEKIYRISSFDKEKEHIRYIYDSADYTSKIQDKKTDEWAMITKRIDNFSGDQIKTISIDPISGKGEFITILTDLKVKEVIAHYISIR